MQPRPRNKEENKIRRKDALKMQMPSPRGWVLPPFTRISLV